MTLIERFHVNGEPRDADLADLDGDGWNDAVIVIRDADKVQAYRNVQGSLVLSSEVPVGKSPREIALADFNEDGCKDFVVVNRQSYDVSVLFGCGADAVGFQQLDQTYPVDGEVSGLKIIDVNEDGRADVIQVDRASSEISVRLSREAGQLSEPLLFPTGLQPNGFEMVDINGDGHVDVLTANLGMGDMPGAISILTGNGHGAFSLFSTLELPAPSGQPQTKLLALKAADFDGDGLADLVTSFADSRIAFFRGTGQGAFELGADYAQGYPRFVFETRQFAAGDFDQDGDVDLAGVGFYGELGVLENQGNLISQTPLNPVLYGAPELDSHKWYRARELRWEDLNDDHDPELVIGLDAGLAVFHGAAGATFEPGRFQSGPGVPVQPTLPGVDFSVSGFAFGDFDTDGDRDLAVSCFADGCLSILTREDGTSVFREAMKVKVPSAEFVAVGDIDGDGKDDLAGTGRTALWVALSGHMPNMRASGSLNFSRQVLPHPVINEVMSANQNTLVALVGDRYPDWAELYNPLPAAIDLSGWKLDLLKPDGTNESFTFPQGETLLASGRKLVLFASNPAPGMPHTGFRLPDSGGTLTLRAPSGEAVDTVVYPSQNNDMAYARFADGAATFTSTGMATPGSPNVYSGAVPPRLNFRGFDTQQFVPDTPIRLFAEANDDSAVLGVSLSWRRIDVVNAGWNRIVFYDDGLHQDGQLADGLYSGVLESGLPDGAAVQFFLEATDANNATTYLPESPDSVEDTGGSDLYVLAFGQSRAPIELSEVVSNNGGVFQDENMGTPDYVEIRNVSGQAVLLDDYALIDENLEADERFLFPVGRLLQPGEVVLVICDGQPLQGPYHADFRIGAGGDKIYLQQKTVSGVYVTIDAVTVPALGLNASYSRLGARGEWSIWPATPNAPNIPDNRILYQTVSKVSGSELVLGFPVTVGAMFTIETSTNATGPWEAVSGGLGTQVEESFSYPIKIQERSRFFRIRVNDPN